MNLGNIIDRSAHFFPEHPAICIDDQTISYGKLKERTNRVATALIASGISPGDRVALNVPNCFLLRSDQMRYRRRHPTRFDDRCRTGISDQRRAAPMHPYNRR